jgi:hypothetical protein
MEVCDRIGDNPYAVIDCRAWEHLLVYIPLEMLAERLTKKTEAPAVPVME